jgi:phosphopantetheinyl transferase (holo-ACP synthase)
MSGSPPTGALSRRGAAQAISERDAEIERLVVERRAADARAEAHQQQLARVYAEQEAAAKAALAEIGDDQDFERLSAARLRNQTLTYEQDEQLDKMLAARQTAQVYWQLAERGHKTGVARALGELVQQYGLDQQIAFGADVPGIVIHTATVTEARVRAEQSERIKELEKELEGFKTRAAANGRSAPLVGGASAGSGASGRMPDDADGAREWFRYAISSRQSAQPRNGAGAPRR